MREICVVNTVTTHAAKTAVDGPEVALSMREAISPSRWIKTTTYAKLTVTPMSISLLQKRC